MEKWIDSIDYDTREKGKIPREFSNDNQNPVKIGLLGKGDSR